MEGRHTAIIDTSTLINFLAVDRLDLLTEYADYRFIVTEHARAEVKKHYGGQLERLTAAIERGDLDESTVTDLSELAMFARLMSEKCLGQGECASIAAAHLRGMVLAMDDKRATKSAKRLNPDLIVITTVDIVCAAICAGRLSVADADAIKQVWEDQHRFRVKFASSGDLVETE